MKPAAQLTSNLLARKGAALPVGNFPARPSGPDKEAGPAWGNRPAAKPSRPTVASVPRSSKAPPPDTAKPQEDHSDRVAMTLRLEAHQHRRLRLLSVHNHQSARQIMSTALDMYLNQLESQLNMVPCECLKTPK